MGFGPVIVEAEQFTLEALPAADRKEALDMGMTIRAAVIKGLFHRLDGAAFAPESNVKSIEMAAALAIQKLEPAHFERMRPAVVKLRDDAARLGQLTGMTMQELLKAGAVKGPSLQATGAKGAPAVAQAAMVQSAAAAAPKYKRLDLNLRAVHCVDETNPEIGSDSMVVGAVRVGASGNIGVTAAIPAGDYDDGTRRSFGELPFGTVSLLTTKTWPKTFYWIFQLVESDSDDAEVANALTGFLSVAASAVAGAFGGKEASTIAAAIIDTLKNLIGIFIDDDYFPPYGVAIKLNSENEFGPGGIRDEHTQNISDHGGSYRLGYRLRFV